MVCRKTRLQDCTVSLPPLILMAQPHQKKLKQEENKIKQNYMTGCWTKSPHTLCEKRGQIHSLRLHTVNIITRWEAAMTCHRLVCPPLSLWLLCNHHFLHCWFLQYTPQDKHKAKLEKPRRRHSGDISHQLKEFFVLPISQISTWGGETSSLYAERRRQLKPTPNVFFFSFLRVRLIAKTDNFLISLIYL